MTQPLLTDREDAAVDFVRRYRNARGFSPTVRELAQALGLSSPATAAAVIDGLVQKGQLRRTRGIPRSLVVTGDPS